MIRVVRTIAELALLAVILAGLAARVAEMPGVRAGLRRRVGQHRRAAARLSTAAIRGTFLHPSLYYDVTAVVVRRALRRVHALGIVDRSLSMAGLVRPRPALVRVRRAAVSVAVRRRLAMWALYALGRALWDRLSGLAAAALLAVLPLHAVYSPAVRVDSLFLAVFVLAFSRIVRRCSTRAAPATTPPRSRPASLPPPTTTAPSSSRGWPLHMPSGRRRRRGLDADRAVQRAALLAGAAFLVANPFVVLDAATFTRQFTFQSGLAVALHPGAEGRGVLYYVTDVIAARTHPRRHHRNRLRCHRDRRHAYRALRAVASVAYFAAFSIIQTKYDRFILPAVALFLVMAAGLPFVVARQARSRRAVAMILASVLLAATIASLAPRAIPLPRHDSLAATGRRTAGLDLDQCAAAFAHPHRIGRRAGDRHLR